MRDLVPITTWLAGVVIATVGTDLFTQTETLTVAAALLAVALLGLGVSALRSLGVLGDTTTLETPQHER